MKRGTRIPSFRGTRAGIMIPHGRVQEGCKDPFMALISLGRVA